MSPRTPPRFAPWLLLCLCVAGAVWLGTRPPLRSARHAVASPLGSGARNTAMADLNGDGRPDLAVADMSNDQHFGPDPDHANDTSAVSIWLNTGQGRLRRYALLRGLQANLVAGADLDQDGDVDLVTGNWEGDSLLVLLNDGHANFERAGRVPAPRPRNFVLGDMNNDHVPDLVLKGDSCSITVGYNDGHARFALKNEKLSPLFPDEKSTDQPLGTRIRHCPFEVALADVDRDGDLDIVTLNEPFRPTTLSIIYNDGAHGKLEIEDMVFADNYVANLTIGDVNGDGWPDLVMSGITGDHENPNVVFMLLNDGHGSYGTSHITMGGLDNGPQDEQWGPTLARRLSTGSLDAWRVALGDVDHDGDLDLIVSSHWGEMGVRRNNGHATFADLYRIRTRQAYQPELPIGDLDGDGRLEWLVPQPGAGPRRPGNQVVLTRLH